MNNVSNELPAPERHSKQGLISCGLVVFTVVTTIFLAFIVYIPEAGSSAKILLGQIYSVFAVIIAPLLFVAGLILGIIGAFKKGSSKASPIVGIVFNSLALIVIAVYWVLILLLIYVAGHTVWR